MSHHSSNERPIRIDQLQAAGVPSSITVNTQAREEPQKQVAA
jgi:hypothetical protein